MLQVMAESDADAVREGTNQYSLYFVIAGVTVGIATFVQVSQQQVIIMKSVLFQAKHFNVFHCYRFCSYKGKFHHELAA